MVDHRILPDFLRIAAVSLALLLVSCGGGGGTPASSPASAAYRGSTSAAIVTPANAEALVMGGYGGSNLGTALGGAGTSSVRPAAVSEADRRLRRLARAVRSSTRRMVLPRIFPLAPAGRRTAAPERISQVVIPGDAGGTATYTLDINDSTGSFSGTIVYNDFSSAGIVLSGNAGILGTFDANRQSITRITLSFGAITMRADGSSATLIGTLSWSFSVVDFSETLSIDMVAADRASGQTDWFRDYVLSTAYGDGSLTQSCSGRYYSPDHGFVELTTEFPLTILNGSTWPSQGRLKFAGGGGTWAILTFSGQSLAIEADTDADNNADWRLERPTNDLPDPNITPIAEAGPDQAVRQGETVVLDGGASTDPNGSPLSYSWRFQSCPQDSCPGLTGGNTSTPSFIAPLTGSYVLGLTVFDGQAASLTDTVSVTVSPVVASDPAMIRLAWEYGIFGMSIGQAGLTVSDLDGDGTPEIVASATPGGYSANTFWYVLRRGANGTYEQIWRSGNYPVNIVHIAVADLEGDGIPEVLVGLADGRILIHDGATLAQTGTVNTAAPLTAFEAGDLDSDGHKEIVTSNGTGVFVYASGTGSLKWSLSSGGGSSLAVGNVDGDPALEIVTTSNGGHGFVIDGVTRAVEWDYINSFGAIVGLGDLDNDGMQEIVGAASWYKITVFDADRRTPVWEIPTSLDIGALRVGDSDGDGVPEILYGDGQWGRVHAVDAVTHADKWSIANPSHGVSGIAVGDVDRDGRIEVLWGAGGTDSGPDHLYVADPSTGAVEWLNPHLDGPLSAVAVGDVNDDGKDEIVMVSRGSDSGYAEGVLSIFDARTHALEYQAKLGNRDWMGVRSVRIGDVDGDGKTEIVVTTGNLYTGVLSVYDGTTRALKRQSAGYNGNFFTTMAIGDVDGDGKVDIVAGQGSSSSGASGAYLIVFDGATMAEKWRSVDLGASWGGVYDIKLADVDGDGHIDIVASHSDSRLVVYDGVTHDLKCLKAIPARALEVADIDGDGRKEILAGRTDGNIDVLDGSTFALKKSVGSSGSAPVDALRIADLDGDGIAEWLLAGGTRLTILDGQGQGLRWRSAVLAGSLGLYNQIPVKDTDGNGRKEIIAGSDISIYQFE